MKIGIVTLYSAYNYGAYLQAYAIQKALKGMGHNPYFIKMESTYKAMRRGLWGTQSFKDLIFNIRKVLAFSSAWMELKKGKFQENDVLVLGSDEIWNINSKGFKQHPYYFGEGLNASKKIAYAPSIGFTPPEEIAANEFCVKNISQMDAILARDASTAEAVEKIIGKAPESVLDPTLIVDWNIKERKKKGYIVLYSYSDIPELKKLVSEFAQQRGLEVISPCFIRRWCKNSPCSPKQFIKLLGGADYVVTTTFHGTIFSILNHAQLLVKPSGQKVRDILSKLGLSDRIFEIDEDEKKFADILDTKIDYTETDKRITELRAQSIESFKKALSQED